MGHYTMVSLVFGISLLCMDGVFINTNLTVRTKIPVTFPVLTTRPKYSPWKYNKLTEGGITISQDADLFCQNHGNK